MILSTKHFTLPTPQRPPMRVRTSLVTAFLLAILASPLHAWTYGDTLTTIWRPLPNLPALARPGDSFAVWADAPSSAGAWSASLQYGALNVPLVLSGGGWQATNRWEFSFTVPLGTPEEIYNLVLSSDATAPDTSQHSVKVLPLYRSDYYFAQVSDTHLPEHAFSSGGSIDVNDTTGMADFQAVIEDLNVIHPEFVIHTGDLVNEGELEEYLGMFEMGRAKGILSRLHAPIFIASGNHDLGGWGATPPPDGTARKNWWRYFGWPNLENPPASDPHHSQDFSFDYGPLHVIGLEGYINSGSYDHYRQDIWGAQSFTAEQMTWLQNDIAAQPPGTHKLLFYHYDFGGTLANGQPGSSFSQIDPAALGIDGAIWGHNHGVAEGNRTAQPFNLGLQSVIDRRAFRIFRVSNGVLAPGPMHRSGGISSAPTDSMSLAWNGPNDGSRRALSVTVNNRFGEAWPYGRIVFHLADHDSTFAATNGTIAQTIRQGGIASVHVDRALPAGGVVTVSVEPLAPLVGAPERRPAPFALHALAPNPFRGDRGADLAVRWSLPRAGSVRIEVLDVSGRRVATLEEGPAAAGEHVSHWDGHTAAGAAAAPALYFVRMRGEAGVLTARFVLAR